MEFLKGNIGVKYKVDKLFNVECKGFFNGCYSINPFHSWGKVHHMDNGVFFINFFDTLLS